MMKQVEMRSPGRVVRFVKDCGFALFGCAAAAVFAFGAADASAAVTLESEVKIHDRALFFDGDKVAKNAPNRPGYDYFFGNRISPHGDCIKEYKGFVFMTWYRGGEADRHVMLSRYNPKTGKVKTIKFPHRHTGYLNQPHIGESHNTIAVGIAPKDGTIHMLYDMHAYDENRPSDGAFANDYFRYSYSVKNAATVPDDEFTLDLFVNSNSGNYKHLKMRNDVDYRALTYPHFFTNKEGDLFMWIREGGNTNGAYKWALYNGKSWSKFSQFNILNAKSRGLNYNWGLYGDIKFENGKMRIGFSRRSTLKNDKYQLNNGHYYAYTDDPLGASQWKDHRGKSISLPVINPEVLKISEPGDELNVTGANSIYMSSGTDWTVTEREDLHFVTTNLQKSAERGTKVKVHTYRKAGETRFKTTTNFPGGNLYSYKNDVYLIGLNAGRVFVDRTPGGENNWQRIYQAPSDSRKYRHGSVHISNGKLYYFLMENKSGSGQPIYLQTIDLGFDVEPEPPVDPADQAPEGFEFAVYSPQVLEVTRPVDIAFGRDGEFIYRTNIRNNIECKTSICSKDPAPGQLKACHIRESKTTYGERYIAIPGVLEFEYYDYGGNNVSYFDSSPELNKGAEVANFRVDEGVDITRGNGGQVISWTGDDEWVEYTVYVHEAGIYRADIVASATEAGEVSILRNGSVIAGAQAIASTGNIDKYEINSVQLQLPAGEQRLRIVFNKGGFNLDKINFVGVAQ